MHFLISFSVIFAFVLIVSYQYFININDFTVQIISTSSSLIFHTYFTNTFPPISLYQHFIYEHSNLSPWNADLFELPSDNSAYRWYIDRYFHTDTIQMSKIIACRPKLKRILWLLANNAICWVDLRFICKIYILQMQFKYWYTILRIWVK